MAREARTISSSANIMPGYSAMVAHNLTRAVNKRSHYVYKTIDGVVSLSVFGGNFVLVKVRLGLIGVRCSELRGVRFSEV